MVSECYAFFNVIQQLRLKGLICVPSLSMMKLTSYVMVPELIQTMCIFSDHVKSNCQVSKKSV